MVSVILTQPAPPVVEYMFSAIVNVAVVTTLVLRRMLEGIGKHEAPGNGRDR